MRTAKNPKPPEPPKIPWYSRLAKQVGEAIGNAKWGS